MPNLDTLRHDESISNFMGLSLLTMSLVLARYDKVTYLFGLPVRHPDPRLGLCLPGDGEPGHGQPVLGGDQTGLLVTVMDRGDHATWQRRHSCYSLQDSGFVNLILT